MLIFLFLVNVEYDEVVVVEPGIDFRNSKNRVNSSDLEGYL